MHHSELSATGFLEIECISIAPFKSHFYYKFKTFLFDLKCEPYLFFYRPKKKYKQVCFLCFYLGNAYL